MITDDHVDILQIAGIEHSQFVASGGDITIKDKDARVYRKGSAVVYRSGAYWDDHLSEPSLDRDDH